MSLRRFALAIGALSLSACYHAVVDTGRAPSGTVIDRPFANSFIYGIVPVADIETATACPSGVARVETEQSVLNSVVSIVTLGLWTPQHVRITCAASATGALPSGRVIDVGAAATERDRAAAVNAAAERALDTGAPMFVRF